MQPPVRVKIYGLFWVTKRTYLICIAVGAGGLVAVLTWWFLSVAPPTLGTAIRQPALQWFDVLPESEAFYSSLVQNRDSLDRIGAIGHRPEYGVSAFRIDVFGYADDDLAAVGTQRRRFRRAVGRGLHQDAGAGVD